MCLIRTLFFLMAPFVCAETVYVDGIFDLAHYGHQRAFQKARETAAKHFGVAPEKIKVIVGVCGGDIKAYKREPVFTLEQRAAQSLFEKNNLDCAEKESVEQGLRILEKAKI